ncbi:hypothetical protein AK812_SmicGene44026, partial [Symbiodinium microadriaticum]
MALAHSVQEEHNFVSFWHAGWYGINASFDVAMESLGISHSIAVDPRLTTSEDEVFHTFWSIEGDLGGDQVMRGDGRPSQQACSDAARLGVEHLGQDLVLSDCSALRFVYSRLSAAFTDADTHSLLRHPILLFLAAGRYALVQAPKAGKLPEVLLPRTTQSRSALAQAFQ